LATLADENNQSVNDRFRYYGQAFDTFLENPILGIGIGNWELKSIETDSENIYGYTVPYHVHNDYLELAAETGFVGMALYFSILVTVIFRLLRQLFLNRSDKSNVLYYFLVCSLAVYLIDALFNFPTARPIQQINMLILLSFSMTLFKDDPNNTMDFLRKYRLNKGVLFILLLASPVALYSSYRVYNAYTQHYYLLGQYNTNNYVQDLDQVLEFEDTYPSLLPTTIPTSTMKGIFHIKKNKDYKSAIKSFKKGIKDNPYLMMSESYMGYSYLMLNELDSAYYYSKKAFDKIPNNPVHFANYLFALSKKRDTLAIQEARKKMTLVKDKKIDALYYKALANLLDKDNSRIILNNLSQELLNTNNDDLKGSIYVLEYGKEMVLKAALLHEEGVRYFENRNYEMAGKSFEEASKLNRLEVPYFENAANAYIQAGENQKALEILNTVLEEIDDQNSKVMYMKALVLFDLNKNEEACVVLNKLINGVNELKIPRTVLDNFCNPKN
jgi:tetratricopeptide (TPR) repeat protein